MLGEINPVYILTRRFCYTYFNIPYVRLRFPTDLPPSAFPATILYAYAFLIAAVRATCRIH
jgi:hypothetical protein